MATPRPFRDGWRVQIQKDGERISKVFRTKREAAQWANEQDAKKTPLRAHTLGQAVTRYLDTVSVHKRNAVDWERRRFDGLLGFFGDVPLGDITTDDVARWRDSAIKINSGSTVHRYAALYRSLFRTAWREWKWIQASPFEGVKLPKENDPRRVVWRWQEIRRVLREGEIRGGKIGETTRAFHVALRTGMRLQEALTYRFDERRRVAVIPSSKTSAKPEEIPLTKQAARLLGCIQSITVGPNEASVLFSELCRQLLIEGLQFRDSRATALTLLARKVDILTLARISRHRNLELLRSTYYRESAEEISRRL